VSSLLLRDGGSSAIVTDRDLRARVLAEGVDARRSVGDVASSPLITREGDATAGELLELMLEHRIHHVPVVDDHGDVAGIVTDTDIMALERRSVFLLRREIASATSAEEIARSGHRLPVMVADLVDASVDPLEVGHLVAVISDALTTRLLEVGVANLGEPPCPWSWLAFGSQARREQGLATDQDNGLAYGVPDGEVDPAAVDPYFARLATFVNDGLAEAGIPRCRAGVIASDPEWRGSVQDWQARFRGWVNDPGRKGSAFSGIAFDYRSVAGSLDVHPDLDPIVRWAGDQPDFLRHLARTAVLQRPPKGFVEDAVIEPRGTSVPTLDAKQSGIAVITNIARLLALRAGVLDNRTTRRLRSVVDAGHLDEDTGAALEEAFTLLWQIRFEHQSRRVRLGAPADDDVDPRLLGPLTRQALKEAFGIIDRVQGAIATDLGIRR